MSASRKLFIAAALLATGLGVAYLLGEPAAIKQALDRSTAEFVVAASGDAGRSRLRPSHGLPIVCSCCRNRP